MSFARVHRRLAAEGLLDNLEKSQTDPKLNDFALVCDGEHLACSKFVLSAHSVVFRAMFDHDGTLEAERSAAIVEDATPQALELFLRMMYSARAELSYETAK